jgi:hypothetical protein
MRYRVRTLLVLMAVCFIAGCVNSSNGGSFVRVPTQVQAGEDFEVRRELLLTGYPIGDITTRYDNERCFVRFGADGEYEEFPLKRKRIDSKRMDVVSIVPGERTREVGEVSVYWTLSLDGTSNGGEHEARTVKVEPSRDSN